MKGTCIELYNKGFLKPYNCYIKIFKLKRCKKFLGVKIKYTTKHQQLYYFKRIDTDGRFIFEIYNNFTYQDFLNNPTYSSCGQKVELKFKKLKKIILK